MDRPDRAPFQKIFFSISLRLTCWFSAIFLAGFLVFGSLMWFDLALSLSQGRDRTLTNRCSRLIQLLRNSRRDSDILRGSKFDNFAQATPEGRLIQVFDASHHRIYPSGSDALAFPWPPASQAAESFLGVVNFRGRRFRVFGRRLDEGGQPLYLLLAGQLEDNRIMLSRFTEGLLWVTPLVMIISGFAGYFVSRRALDPVNRLIASTRSITIGNLSRRLPVSASGDELARLAETCNEMLERLEKAVGQITRFTADASHELRSPIAFIRTVAESALRLPGLDPEGSESFKEIVVETKHAAELLEDMLLLARADSGHTDAAFEILDLCPLVGDAINKNQSFAAARGQHLSLTLLSTSVMVWGDRNRLQRLLGILLDNAMKYTPETGCIRVAVALTAEHAVITVEDTGIGIPSSSLPHIFDRFFRVDSARSQYEGTGLGLAIAKWIADIHLATIQVETRENCGSIFRVLLPHQTTYINGVMRINEYPVTAANL